MNSPIIQDTALFCNHLLSHPYYKQQLENDGAAKLRFSLLPSDWLVKKAKGRVVPYEREVALSAESAGLPIAAVTAAGIAAQLEKLFAANEKGFDLFYFVNAVNCSERFATNNHITARLFLPVDIDIDLPCSPFELADEFGLRPWAIVQTSSRTGVDGQVHRRHQYLFAVQASGAEEDELRAVCLKLGDVMGGDNMSDLKRIFRLPGSINWKGHEEGRSLSRAVLLYADQGESVWPLGELDFAAEKFGQSNLGKALAGAYQARVSSPGKKLRHVNGSAREAGQYGHWEDAVDAAEAGEASVGEGERHSALMSWGGQLAASEVPPGQVEKILTYLAREACVPSYGQSEEEQKDFRRVLDYVRKFASEIKGSREEELKRGFSEESGEELEEPRPVMDLEEVIHPSKLSINLNELPVVENLLKLPSEQSLPGVVPVAPTVEERIPEGPVAQYLDKLELIETEGGIRFQKLLEREICTQSRVERLLIGFNFMRRKKPEGDESLIVDAFCALFRALKCEYGRYLSARIQIEIHGNDIQYTKALEEEELLTLIDAALLRASRFCRTKSGEVSEWPKIKERLDIEKKFSLIFAAGGKDVSKIVSGVTRRYGGMFARKKTQSPSIIVFQNGFYDLEKNKFIENNDVKFECSNPTWAHYTEESRWSWKNSMGVESAFLRFLGRTFPNDPATIELVHRMIGYSATTHMAFHVWFIFEGVTRTGKSTLSSTIGGMLGVNNFTVTRYAQLAAKDSLSGCPGKTLCIVEEAQADQMKEGNASYTRLKEASSGERVAIRPLFEPEYATRLTSKFVLLTNKGLEFEDVGGAGIARMVPLQFANPVPIAERDADLKERLLRETNIIMSDAARALGESWTSGAALFDMPQSKALQEGRRLALEHTDPVGALIDQIFQCGVRDKFLPAKLVANIIDGYLRADGKKPRGRLDVLVKERLRVRGVHWHGDRHFLDQPGIGNLKFNCYECGLKISIGQIEEEIRGSLLYSMSPQVRQYCVQVLGCSSGEDEVFSQVGENDLKF